MGKILVIGASGTVGSKLSTLLKQRNQDVLRATSQKNLRPDQVHVDLVTGEGFDVIDKVEKLFLLSPPGRMIQDKLLIPMIDRAKKTGIKKIVLLTAMGTDLRDDVSMRKVELHLERSGLNYNIIRPNWFMQNYNYLWVQGINSVHKVQLPVGDAKAGFIDARDISAVAAELLLTDKFNHRAFDITGPEALDQQSIVDIISKVSGRKITFEDISVEQMTKNLEGAGFSGRYTDFILLILNNLKHGNATGVSNSVEEIIGRKPISFQKYAEDYKQSWIV